MAATQLAPTSGLQLGIIPDRPGHPEWIDPACDNREEKFRDWLLREIYWTMADKVGVHGKQSTIAEAVAQACQARLEVTADLRQVMDQSLIVQLWEAKQLRWYTLLGPSYDSLEKVLSLALKDASESERYDLTFWLETLLPCMEYLQMPPEQVLKVPEKFSKARAAVPTLRRLWRELEGLYRDQVHFTHDADGHYWRLGAVTQGPFEDEDKALADYQRHFYMGLEDNHLQMFSNRLFNMVEMITGDTSVMAFKDELKQMSGAALPPPITMDAYLFVVGGEDWILVKSPNRGQTQILEDRLKGVIPDLGIRDPMSLISEINQWFASTRAPRQTFVLDAAARQFRPDPNGISLPTRDAMNQTARLELAKAWAYLVQSEQTLYVPLLELVPAKNALTDLLKFLGINPNQVPPETQNLLAWTILPEALNHLYAETVTNAARSVLPKGSTFTLELIRHVTDYVTYALAVTCHVTVT